MISALRFITPAALGLFAAPAFAAEGLDGAQMSPLWGLPFAGILLSIALGPLVAQHFWHHHYGKISFFWALLCIAPLGVAYGFSTAGAAFFHTMMLEYVPFILMLFALFTAAGGLVVRGSISGTPLVNTGLLAFGASIASIVGTTGASMILIRPLLRANEGRKHQAHVVVFFIFLVSNIGGALTPLGDPPLFLGFLRGVDFFWTTTHLLPQTVFSVLILLAVFFALDSWLARGESARSAGDEPVRVTGLVNLGLIAVAVGAIVMSGAWKPGIAFEVFGTPLELQNLLREAIMVAVGLASLALSSQKDREDNGFNWEPIREVGLLFAGIFTCIIPVMAMLGAGKSGPFAALVSFVFNQDGSPNNAAFFWLTGILSSFLDNAPTYLVFFEMAGGDAAKLMGPLASTLTAISLGAVFMGANTYVGNAPNFMVYSIARSANVNMPSFFGYMLWSGAVLIPLFGLVHWVFIR
jgi:Na+/H+ antiporter NhaD/arsenite permease-like protein